MPKSIGSDQSTPMMTITPSGLTIVTETVAASDVVACGVWVRGGSRAESPTQRGGSHLLEHLAFSTREGSEERGLLNRLGSFASQPQALTTKEFTSYTLRLRRTDFADGFAALAQLISRPELSTESVDAERGAVASEMNQRRSDGLFVGLEQIDSDVFAGSSLALTVAGTEGDLSRLSDDVLPDLHASRFRASNVLIAAAGGVDHATLVDLSERLEFSLMRRPKLPAESPPQDPSQQGHRFVDGPQAGVEHVVLGVRAPAARSPEGYVVRVIDTMLSGGIASLLFRRLRGAGAGVSTYRSGSFYTAYSDAGELVLFASTEAENGDRVMTEMRDALAQLAAGDFSDQDLREAIVHLQSATVLGSENSTARCNRIATSTLYTGAPSHLLETLNSVATVDRSQLVKVLGTMLAAGTSAVTVRPSGTGD